MRRRWPQNAAGCTVRGDLAELKARFIGHVQNAMPMDGLLIVDKPAGPTSPTS